MAKTKAPPPRPTVAILVPCYNEADNLKAFVKAFDECFGDISFCVVNVVFIDDGSSDATAQIIFDLSSTNKNIKFIKLTKNCGKEIALTAALDIVESDAYILMDADLQHPMSTAFEMSLLWAGGKKHIAALDNSLTGRPLLRRFLSRLRKIIQKLNHVAPKNSGATDFRLLDRSIVLNIRTHRQRTRFLRSLMDDLGGEVHELLYVTADRQSGKAKFRMSTLFRLGVIEFVLDNSYVIFWTFLVGVFALSLGLLGLLITVVDVITYDFLNVGAAGYFILAILSIVGLTTTMLSVVIFLISLVFNEVKPNPLYVVESQFLE
jgi:glycosyltransferase involved in cell wall biosynthesis